MERSNQGRGKPAGAAGADSGYVSFRLLVPVTRIGVGAFSFDMLDEVLGRPLEGLLSPVMCGPVEIRNVGGGMGVRSFPLRLASGVGTGLNLGKTGEILLHNDGGRLRIAVPWLAGGWLSQRLGAWLERGPEAMPSSDGRSTLAVVWVKVGSGLRAAVPIPGIGEVGVEV